MFAPYFEGTSVTLPRPGSTMYPVCWIRSMENAIKVYFPGGKALACELAAGESAVFEIIPPPWWKFWGRPSWRRKKV